MLCALIRSPRPCTPPQQIEVQCTALLLSILLLPLQQSKSFPDSYTAVHCSSSPPTAFKHRADALSAVGTLLPSSDWTGNAHLGKTYTGADLITFVSTSFD